MYTPNSAYNTSRYIDIPCSCILLLVIWAREGGGCQEALRMRQQAFYVCLEAIHSDWRYERTSNRVYVFGKASMTLPAVSSSNNVVATAVLCCVGSPVTTRQAPKSRASPVFSEEGLD